MMDSENHIFEPDVILASEMSTQRSGLPEPERMLMIAVLEEAARCFSNYGTASDRKQRALYEEARDWFASEDRSHLYAFENVCDVLGIDPAWLRRRLLQARNARRARADAHCTHDAPRVAGAEVAPEHRRASGT